MDSGHVLLVDDDVMLLNALSHTIALRLIGVEVETSNSAEAALERMQQHEYDAVVSDIKMPGMDGMDLLSRISEQQPDVPVLLITGHGEHDLAIRALRGGAYDYILKPIDRDDFIASLHRALHTHHLRRQNQEQLRTLERYALSLEQQIEQRTYQLDAVHMATDTTSNMLSHELGTLLACMKAITQLLDLQFPHEGRTEEIGQCLADMEASVHRIESLIPRVIPT